MKILLVLTSIIFPLSMFILQKFRVKFRFIFNIGAIISILIFGNIASLSILEIINNRTVFMTNIHALFLDPIFLTTGAYLGVYILYQLLVVTLDQK
ncbi:transposase [Bacillus sp. FJAT-29790]|uniref:transposase n=1 Tax=Bacillus sp. FJAT-29790 TaxID=1895002 RepID=UPI001C21FE69|nr:transposase [Bacillus sp. FJAT-29790]MBU8878994.1 transposase [Bacillus sp. FJAT-29790]